MSEGPIIIAGIPIPFRNPALLVVLGIHVAAALAGVITGLVAMMSSKGPGRHPVFGTRYYRFLSVAFVTSLVLALFRWEDDRYLAVLGTLAFIAASLGRRALRSHRPFRIQEHITGMGLSYTLMLVAFYMDNGRNLPLWRDLPAAMYWLAPGAIGTGLILHALRRHRSTRPV